MTGYPLDLKNGFYSYLERPNRSILHLLQRPGLLGKSDATILDIGCGCGANARAIREWRPATRITGIEPDPRAAELASQVCERVFTGSVEQWLQTDWKIPEVDVVLLSDVLEHIPDPVSWLRTLMTRPELRHAAWIVSVPNYAVWYNRLLTLIGRFEYQCSGLYDRTHLRFYTRRSLHKLLEYCGLNIEADRCTASIVQAWAPLIRRSFESQVVTGDHLALLDSGPFRFYRQFVEPLEEAICNVWKGLLGFQIVVLARRNADGS